MKREFQFGKLFRHWLKANPMPSAAFELKQTTTDSIPFSDVKEHQIDALLAAHAGDGFLYKIPDDSAGIKPFDFVYLNDVQAYVVIRYPGAFYLITVARFLLEKQQSTRKSLTSKRAGEIASFGVKL